MGVHTRPGTEARELSALAGLFHGHLYQLAEIRALNRLKTSRLPAVLQNPGGRLAISNNQLVTDA